RGNSINEVRSTVVGKMVSDGASLQEVIRTLLGPSKRAFERSNVPNKGQWRESEEIALITEKYEYYTKRDKAKSAATKMKTAEAEPPSPKTKRHEFDYDPPEQPTIDVSGGELSNLATLGEKALRDAREPIFQRGGMLVRPIIEEVIAAHGRTTK